MSPALFVLWLFYLVRSNIRLGRHSSRCEDGRKFFRACVWDASFPILCPKPGSRKDFQRGDDEWFDAEKAAVTQTYDFSTIHKLVDIGGGQGSFISSILKANPNLKGVLFDLPSVVKVRTK
jgi:hypothetical protein